MKTLISTVLLVVLYASMASATSVKFYEGDLLAAREKASAEGKLFFIDFYAKWCMPCKWMDQTTFSDPGVGELMNAEYVSVKVNIDDLVGFNLSQKYDIQVLPTILIFNQEGQMIDRIEETMTPTKMMAILNSHVSKTASSRPITRSVNRSPRTDAPITPVADSRSSYKLQMGAYTQYEAAASKVVQLQDQFLEPIVVVNDVQDDQVVFKIMMGHFSTKEEADSFKKILKDKYLLDSFVR